MLDCLYQSIKKKTRLQYLKNGIMISSIQIDLKSFELVFYY